MRTKDGQNLCVNFLPANSAFRVRFPIAKPDRPGRGAPSPDYLRTARGYRVLRCFIASRTR
jgi:hypothetical protein